MATVTGVTADALNTMLAAKADTTDVLSKANNLSDVQDIPTVRSNLNLSQRLYFDVRDAGAVGDGTTDDTTAINNAITAASAVMGTVYIPPGLNCKITSSLNFTVAGVSLIGGGSGSRITYDGSVVTTAIKSTGNIRINISDIRISQTNASHVGTAIDLSNNNGSVVERVLIDGGGASGVAPNIGILLNSASCHYNIIRDCRINYGGTAACGVKIVGGSHSNTIQDLRLVPQGEDTASSGVYIAASHSITLIHPDVETCTGNGIWLDTGADGTTILNAYSEANGINLKISSGVLAPVILGGTYQSGTTANVQDNGAVGMVALNAWPNSGSNSYNHLDLLNVDKFTVNGVPGIAGAFQPSDQGYAAWTYDPSATTTTTATVSGTVYLSKVTLRTAKTITKVAIGVGTAASGVTANQNFLALIDSSGNVVGKTAAGAIDSALATAGVLSGSLVTPYAAAAGTYWVAFVNNATTPAAVARSGGFTSVPNANLTASNYRYCTNGTGQTSFGSTINPTVNSLTNAFTMWAAIL